MTQWVFADCVVVCPKSGWTGVRANTSAMRICVSFHLKISVPFSARTRKHSSNPLARRARHSFGSLPYFNPCHPFGPTLLRCGGSNTIRLNRPSPNGSSVKSSRMSGAITNSRPSQSVCDSERISPNTASGLPLSNQNMRDPQAGSSTRGSGRSLIAHPPSPTELDT